METGISGYAVRLHEPDLLHETTKDSGVSFIQIGSNPLVHSRSYGRRMRNLVDRSLFEFLQSFNCPPPPQWTSLVELN